jgi:hypothetical protein
MSTDVPAGGAPPNPPIPPGPPPGTPAPGMMPPAGYGTPPGYGAPMGYGTPQNTSGMGKMAPAPPEVAGLCWSGFVFSWIWGVFNGVLISLLAFVPFVGWVMPWVLLFKGNEWAWQGKRWNSVEHFKDVQHKWTIAALIFLAVAVVLAILWVILIIVTGGFSYSVEYSNVVTPLSF